MLRFSANLGLLFTDSPFPERFGRAAAAGFRAVEYMFPYDHDVAELSAALRTNGLRQDLFNLPAGDFAAGERGLAVDPRRRDEFAAGVERALATADRLGCRKLNCLVGRRLDGLGWETQYACLVENLRGAAERVASAGITLLVELLNPVETPGFFLDSIAVVGRLLDDVAMPNLKFQFDAYHVQRTQGELVPTFRALADRIGHVQIADAPERHEPGTGEINYRYVLAQIEAAGYDGCVGLEYRPSGPTEESLGWIEAYGYHLGGQVGDPPRKEPQA